MRHFWNWVRNDDESRTLYLEGVIAEESWFADDITPAMFKEELFAGNGPITIHLNSPGGDCIAASQIYTMLMDYPGDVTIQIDGMAASAASVIAMAGTHVTINHRIVLGTHKINLLQTSRLLHTICVSSGSRRITNTRSTFPKWEG